MPLKYKQVEKVKKDDDGNIVEHIAALKLVEGEYEGLIWSYGKVVFREDPENDRVGLGFEYVIHDTPISEDEIDKDLLSNQLGDILWEILEEKMNSNELVFTGGTDEN